MTSTDITTLSLHDALPISWGRRSLPLPGQASGSKKRPRSDEWEQSFEPALRPAKFPSASHRTAPAAAQDRSEEHTSELQSRRDLVCRLLLEKKNKLQTHKV